MALIEPDIFFLCASRVFHETRKKIFLYNSNMSVTALYCLTVEPVEASITEHENVSEFSFLRLGKIPFL